MHSYSKEDGSRKAALGTLSLLAVGLAVCANWLLSLQTTISPWLFSSPTVAGAFAILYFIMDKYAWKWRIVRLLGLIDTPIISGRYTGTLVSNYGGATRPIEIDIDQTWNRIAIRFTISEPHSSTSYSATAGLVSAGKDHARLTYTYRNQMQPGVADSDMNDHDGTTELEINCATGVARGRYYNFLGNQGSLALSRVEPQ